MPTPHKTRYFFSATIKVLKANSGMLLSCLVVPLLVLLAYGDQMGGTTLSGVHDFPVIVLQLAGLWLMVTGIGALDAMPRINKSFNGAEGMLLWNRLATITGFILEWIAYLLRRIALINGDGFAPNTSGEDRDIDLSSTVGQRAVDTVLLVMLIVVTLLLILRYVGPNTPRLAKAKTSQAANAVSGARADGAGADAAGVDGAVVGRASRNSRDRQNSQDSALLTWIARVPFDVIYPLFNAATIILWGVLAWHMWSTSVLDGSALDTSGIGISAKDLPYLLSAYCIVMVMAALVTIRVMLIQQFRTDRLYPGSVVNITYPNPDTAIVTVELAPHLHRGRPESYWYTAGQYSYLGVPGQKEGPHPFTMTSIPNIVGRTGPTQHVGVGSRMRTQGVAWDRTVEYCIKAGGKGSRWLVDNLAEGMPVTVSTPRGGTHPAHGGVRQLWVAGGIGITPFVAWLRDLNYAVGKDFPGQVTLVWSYHPSEKPAYLNLVRQCAREWPWLTLVEVDTENGERLTPQQAHQLAFPADSTDSVNNFDAADAASAGAPSHAPAAAPLYGEDITTHICGPTNLCREYSSYFLEHGVSPDRIHVDAFHMR